jgi:hypothetical protein
VPQVPRVEQHLAPIVLVVREHAHEGAEAGRVTRLVDAAVEAAVDLDDVAGEVGRPLGQQERD